MEPIAFGGEQSHPPKDPKVSKGEESPELEFDEIQGGRLPGTPATCSLSPQRLLLQDTLQDAQQGMKATKQWQGPSCDVPQL